MAFEDTWMPRLAQMPLKKGLQDFRHGLQFKNRCADHAQSEGMTLMPTGFIEPCGLYGAGVKAHQAVCSVTRYYPTDCRNLQELNPQLYTDDNELQGMELIRRGRRHCISHVSYDILLQYRGRDCMKRSGRFQREGDHVICHFRRCCLI